MNLSALPISVTSLQAILHLVGFMLRIAFISLRKNERLVVYWNVLTLSSGFGIEYSALEHATFHCSFNTRSRRYFVFRNEEAVKISIFGQKKPSIFCFSEWRSGQNFNFRTEEAVDSRWCHCGFFPWYPRQNHVPWGRLSLWKWVPGISPGVKRPVRMADDLPPL